MQSLARFVKVCTLLRILQQIADGNHSGFRKLSALFHKPSPFGERSCVRTAEESNGDCSRLSVFLLKFVSCHHSVFLLDGKDFRIPFHPQCCINNTTHSTVFRLHPNSIKFILISNLLRLR